MNGEAGEFVGAVVVDAGGAGVRLVRWEVAELVGFLVGYAAEAISGIVVVVDYFLGLDEECG